MISVLLAKQFWILDPLYSVLGTVLAWFYGIIPSYGVAIILLTLAVRVVTLPLTAKQAKAQQALQKVQPELKRLQAKYKGDKQKLNEEMMKFYKENHVNPFGSCLPLLIQAPVLIVLYRLIIGLTGSAIVAFTVVAGVATGPLTGATVRDGRITGGELSNGVVTSGTLQDAQVLVGGQLVGTIARAEVNDGKIPAAQVVNGEIPVGTLTDLTVRGGERVGTPKHVPESSDLYPALVKSGGSMESFWMDLSKTAANVKGANLLPYMVLILGVMATGYYQQRQLTARTPKSSANPQMQAIGKIFPVMFGVISFTVPAGVVVYFLISNLWQIGQQGWIFRNHSVADDEESKKDNKKDSKSAKVVDKPAKANPKSAGRATTTGKGKPTPKAKAGGSGARPAGKSGRRGGRPADLRGTKPKKNQNPLGRRNSASKAAPPKNTQRKDDG